MCFTCLGGFVAWRNPSVCERVQPSPYLAFQDSFLKTMMMNKTNFLSGFAWEFFGTFSSPVFWEGKVTKNHMNRNPYNRYINPYYWVDDHPLLYGNNGSLDPGTHENWLLFFFPLQFLPT